MKKIFFLLTFLFVNMAFAQHEHHAKPTADTTKNTTKPKSPRQSAMAMIGQNHVHIDYGSPSVRGRQIWNGLVAYKQVWATGAHKATWVEFSDDVIIEDKTIAKGKYGFFTIPDKKAWTIILSKTWDMHLADDYKPEADIIRIKVKPRKIKKLAEALTFNVVDLGNDLGQISMAWEYIEVNLAFKNSKPNDL